MHPTICDNGFERYERQFVASSIGWSRIKSLRPRISPQPKNHFCEGTIGSLSLDATTEPQFLLMHRTSPCGHWLDSADLHGRIARDHAGHATPVDLGSFSARRPRLRTRHPYGLVVAFARIGARENLQAVHPGVLLPLLQRRKHRNAKGATARGMLPISRLFCKLPGLGILQSSSSDLTSPNSAHMSPTAFSVAIR